MKTNKQKKAELERQVASVSTPEPQKAAARDTLKRYKDAEDDLHDAQTAVIARLDDKQFIAGFGSNGGEEFLSYMNIGESLVVKGGDVRKSWDKSISQNHHFVNFESTRVDAAAKHRYAMGLAERPGLF